MATPKRVSEAPDDPAIQAGGHGPPSFWILALGSIGVVYGDIGTSPLYALKEIFNGHHPIPVTPDNILGILSLVFWAIMVLVTLKYVLIIMRADNRGEGGSLALQMIGIAMPRLDLFTQTGWLLGAPLADLPAMMLQAVLYGALALTVAALDFGGRDA